jgi:hypothetical protein
VVLALPGVYALGAKKAAIPANLAAASCVAVVGLHLIG